jgi:hypothetical protein
MPYVWPSLLEKASRAEPREFSQKRRIRPHVALIAQNPSDERVTKGRRQRSIPLPIAPLKAIQHLVDEVGIR